MKDYKIIAIFTFQSEYTVINHLLEQANLRYIFENELISSVLPFYSNKVGGIRLKVHQEDVKKATAIISSLEDSSHLSIV